MAISSVEKSLLYDSTRDDKPFNMNQYPGYDMDNQYIGLEVPLDKRYRINKSEEKISVLIQCLFLG